MTTGTTLKQLPARVIEWALPYWTRGEPGRQTPADLFRVLYLGWLAAFVLKVLGSTWDVSWHFKWLRDDLAPPHMLNTVGTVIAVGLAIVHWYTGYGVDRTASRLIQWGTGIFLIAIPLDLINHRVNGLDITAWSPSHALLFIGTALMIAGVIRGWYLGAASYGVISDRLRTVVLGVLFTFFFENVHFPEQHQEYGVLELASWDRGQPYAEPSLLQFAADQMGRAVDRPMILKFSLPVPDYVYPVYAGAAGMIILVVARLIVKKRWTATSIAALYVAYRCLVWPILVGGTFPPSAIPFFFLLAGLAVDLAFFVRIPYFRPVLGAALVTAGVYGGLAVQDRVLDAPPYAVASWPVTAALLAAAWLVAEWLVGRRRAPAASTEASPAETGAGTGADAVTGTGDGTAAEPVRAPDAEPVPTTAPARDAGAASASDGTGER
ncbi:hypothetical protein [Planotetraspora kaengkrachanensis]|uniref:hypothetical protein n=1 Tax=Planotetraspora kaengkrachanensis TaxID=575193 RepID=UPI0019416913|nr:hypothetical protein [Planotetraspora kaengkrachanensis]